MTKKTKKTSRSTKARSPKQSLALGKPRPRAKASPAVSPVTGGELFERVATILDEARARVVRVVNTEMVLAYWQIGREIVEHLQRGDVRAGRGEALIEELSARLGARFGRGFSTTNLRYFRTFFLAYKDREPKIREPRDVAPVVEPGAKRAKRQIGSGVLPNRELPALPGPLEGFSPVLGWTHYQLLAKVEHEATRRFYEIEAEQAGWSAKHLERQIHTQLFARLLKSRDKAGVLDLALRGQALERPVDAIKHPYVLDFLDLPEAHQLRERDLETAILDQLQSFLLELGKGFAFVGRQWRLTFEDEVFYIDLVFYNIVLKCHVLIDLKLGKLTHQDVGQMDGYVRLFDDQCRNEGDNPTIGLILCAEKNETIARYSVLHGHEQLFAAKYVTQLPSEEALARELAREARALEGRTVGTRQKRKG